MFYTKKNNYHTNAQCKHSLQATLHALKFFLQRHLSGKLKFLGLIIVFLFLPTASAATSYQVASFDFESSEQKEKKPSTAKGDAGVEAHGPGVSLDLNLSHGYENQGSPILNSSGIKSGLSQTKEIWDNSASGSSDILKVIVGWTNFAIPFASAFLIFGFVAAGYFYIVDTGNGFMKDKGRKILMYSVIGMLFILLAYPAIVYTINYFSV